MPEPHEVMNLSDLKKEHKAKLSKDIKANNGIATLVVHHGFDLNFNENPAYLDHIKRLTKFLEKEKGPIFLHDF